MKIYFASDQHLGAPNHAVSQQREQRFVHWLDSIQHDAAAIYLLGDLFDFWFEYRTVVPRGYVRVLGKLAMLRDAGIPIYFFTGNHDLWMFGYFEQELGIPVYHQPQLVTIDHKVFLIGHGDGLGPHDMKYKLVKRYLFTNPICQKLLHLLHPDVGIGLANYLSRRSRQQTGTADDHYLGDQREYLVQYAYRKLQTQHIDFFVFGHRHLPLTIPIHQSCYVNTGDWIKYNSYAVYEHQQIHLCYHTM